MSHQNANTLTPLISSNDMPLSNSSHVGGVRKKEIVGVNQERLRLAALLLLVGILVSATAGFLHPDREHANNHPAVFAEYAQSTSWIAVHLGQFAGMTLIVGGLLTLFLAVKLTPEISTLLACFGAAAAIISLALYGLLQAVDGVALKHTVDAWASASEAERMTRFATAETIRWLEWAARGYHSFVLGLSLVLYGSFIVVKLRGLRPIGYLMGLCGLGYFVQGWIVSEEGFSTSNSLPALLTIVLFLAWSIWLLVLANTKKAIV